MAVELTQQVEGKNVGDSYSGEREEWLVENGYAKKVERGGEHVKPATKPVRKEPVVEPAKDTSPKAASTKG